jgi:tetratricopeptide (TPR) repeat protein
VASATSWLALLSAVLFTLGAAAATALAQDDVPEVARTAFEQAERLRTSGRLDEAIAGYREVVRLAPAMTEAYVALGALYTQQDELERALETFSTGLEHAPRESALLFNAAVVAQRLERFDDGLEYVRRALAAERSSVELLQLESSILRRLGRNEEALRSLETAVKSAPNDASVLFALGNTYHELDRNAEAIDTYRRAIRRDKKLLRAHYNLGAVLFEDARYAEALEAYQVALEPIDQAFARGEQVDPAHAQAYLNLGAIHYRTSDWERALAAYDKAVRLDGTQTSAWYNLGFINYRLGRESEAEVAYRRALALDPSLPLAYLHLAEISRNRADFEPAVVLLEQGLPRLAAADATRAHQLLAEIYHALGRDADAERSYRKVLQEDPGEVAALGGLGALLRRRGNHDEATQLLERARQAAPDDARLALELAALARARGDLVAEGELYRAVLASRGGAAFERWPLELNLAMLALGGADLEEARTRLAFLVSRLDALLGSTGVVVSAELVPRIELIYALLLAGGGEVALAEEPLSAALARLPEDDLAAHHARSAFDGLAREWNSAAQGLVAVLEGDQLQAYEEAADRGREIRGQLGLVLWWGLRSQDARSHLAAAAGAFPDWLEVRAALGEAYLEASSYPSALQHLGAAGALCRKEESTGSTPQGYLRFDLDVAKGGRAAICQRLPAQLGITEAAAAFRELVNGSFERARDGAERALELPLSPAYRSVAQFVRGSASIGLGEHQPARRDLEAALAGALPDVLLALAETNLGVALHTGGESARARSVLERVVGREDAPPAAVLDLGILLDEAQDNAGALRHYDEYVRRGGTRGAEVSGWIDRLRRLTP